MTIQVIRNPNKVEFIKHEIQRFYGRQILSSRDCIILSEEIFYKTGEKLNPNTLRRFFGLVKADYPPSRATLDILAKYCGFNNFEQVHDQNIERPHAKNN